jgi:hypothetical protein
VREGCGETGWSSEVGEGERLVEDWRSAAGGALV